MARLVEDGETEEPPRDAAAVGLEPEFARGRGRQEPVVEHALLDHQQLLALDALAVEGTRRLAARAAAVRR